MSKRRDRKFLNSSVCELILILSLRNIYANYSLILQESLTQKASLGEFTPHPSDNDILETFLPNKEHPGRVRGLGKNHIWTNTQASAGTSKSKGFQNKVKTNFEKMQEQMLAMQRQVKSLQEQLLRKNTSASARDSCKWRSPYTPSRVEEHVESIVTPPTGRQVNIYLHLCNMFTLSNLLMI